MSQPRRRWPVAGCIYVGQAAVALKRKLQHNARAYIFPFFRLFFVFFFVFIFSLYLLYSYSIPIIMILAFLFHFNICTAPCSSACRQWYKVDMPCGPVGVLQISALKRNSNPL